MQDQKEKKGKNLIARDATGEVSAAMDEIIQYYNGIQSVVNVNESTIIRALIMNLQRHINETKPVILNLNKLF